jgi:tropomyosin
MDADLEKAESKLNDAKNAREEGDTSRVTVENLQRKVQLLEEELDAAEKNVKDTVEK